MKQKFDGLKLLTYEIDHDDLTYYFKGRTAKKSSDGFDNSVERFIIYLNQI